ncbi:hypothetical protein ALC60_02037 [Trachymyrmex zeteki]|uniref:Uncharacterized protein n=1 Tax=Mycetomoellerius zeteki TaxID=64791 RepID=A0A151XEY2_9HYME|nr:hypothetical protein ALC60_02037 [Trachymyrmex zeteki]
MRVGALCPTVTHRQRARWLRERVDVTRGYVLARAKAPRLASSCLTSPCLASPRLAPASLRLACASPPPRHASPRLLSPHLASSRPRLASPRLRLPSASPRLASPPLASSRLVSPPPRFASPAPPLRLATPRLASSRLISPRLAPASLRLACASPPPRHASPRLTSPHLTSPRLISPHLASSRLASLRGRAMLANDRAISQCCDALTSTVLVNEVRFSVPKHNDHPYFLPGPRYLQLCPGSTSRFTKDGEINFFRYISFSSKFLEVLSVYVTSTKEEVPTNLYE